MHDNTQKARSALARPLTNLSASADMWFSFSKGFFEDLKQKVVKLKLTSKSIIFSLDKLATEAELKEIWYMIAEELPDLGKPAEPSSIEGAVSFRKKFGK